MKDKRASGGKRGGGGGGGGSSRRGGGGKHHGGAGARTKHRDTYNRDHPPVVVAAHDVEAEDHADDNVDGGGAGGASSSSVQCPYFSSSGDFQFMTNKAYFAGAEGEESGDGGVDLADGGRERANVSSGKLFKYVRPMSARVAVLGNPHGSARVWQGNTCVLAAVYGPSDVRMSKELPHRAAVDVLFRPKVTGSGNTATMLGIGMMDPVMEERSLEQVVSGILESVLHLEDHVQAGFNVILHELENDGCLLSTCVNAACLALLNAGCSMRCLFAAVTLGVCGEKVVVDPSAKQILELKKQSSVSSCATTSPKASFSLTTFVVTNKCSRGGLRSGISSSSAMPFSPEVLHVSSVGRASVTTLLTCYRLVTSPTRSVVSEVFSFFGGVVSADIMSGIGSSVSSVGGGAVKLESDDAKVEEVVVVTSDSDDDDGEYEDVDDDEEEEEEEEGVHDKEDGEIIEIDDDDDD